MSIFDNNTMSRLPVPGSDEGNWGEILNDYLSVSLDTVGQLKPNTVSAAQIQNTTVTKVKLSADVQTSLGKADAALPATTANATYLKTVNGVGPDANGNVAVGQPDIMYVFVQTGNEVRPAANHAIWVGGVTRPVNTIDGDIWLSES